MEQHPEVLLEAMEQQVCAKPALPTKALTQQQGPPGCLIAVHPPTCGQPLNGERMGFVPPLWLQVQQVICGLRDAAAEGCDDVAWLEQQAAQLLHFCQEGGCYKIPMSKPVTPVAAWRRCLQGREHRLQHTHQPSVNLQQLMPAALCAATSPTHQAAS